MKRILVALPMASLLLATAPAGAAPDELDPDFGVGGQHVLNEDSYAEFGVDVALIPLPDGGFVAVDGGLGFARMSHDARQKVGLDLSPACPAFCFWAVARLQPDGKLVTAFTSLRVADYVHHLAVARLSIDGSLDTGFGAGGGLLLPMYPGRFYAKGIALLPDGAILVGGTARLSPRFADTMAIARFLPNGAPDFSFGSGGYLRLTMQGDHPVVGFLQAANNDVVLASPSLVVRASPTGQIDPEFAANGPPYGVLTVHAIAEQPDGKLLIGGAGLDALGQETGHLTLMRVGAKGRRDPSFGADGVVVFPIEDRHYSGGLAIAVDSRGRIVVAGTVIPPFAGNAGHATAWDVPRAVVARLLPDGRPDLSFAGAGVTTLQTSHAARSSAVAVTSTGAILLGADIVYGGWFAPALFQIKGGEGSVQRPIREAFAVEYQHAGFGHYFVTSDEFEIAKLDDPPGPWRRTGHSFRVWTGKADHLDGVCRFFSGSTFAPKSSHVFTPYPDECAKLRNNPAWTFESDAFRLQRPVGTPGARDCPAGSAPLYRVYNNGLSGAPNHRFTRELGVVALMTGLGWTFEGEAQTKVFACTPLP